MLGLNLGLGFSKGGSSGATMLTSYPAQSNGQAPVTNDFDLNDATQWTLNNNWTDEGDGTFSKLGNGFDKLQQNFDYQTGVTYAAVLGISETVWNNNGVAMIPNPSRGGTFGMYPQQAGLYVGLHNNVDTDNQLEVETGNFWRGYITKAGLFDVTSVVNMPVHIVMCAGQSNMVGVNDGRDIEKDNWHPRIWDMPASQQAQWGSTDTRINLANEPTQYNETSNASVSPAMSCARRIVAAHPNERVVICPMAKNGTNLVGSDANWNPNTTLTNSLDKMYDRLVAQYNKVITELAGATVASVSLIWSQGEADGEGATTYPADFAAMRTQLMTDLSLSELPTVILGRTIPDPQNPNGLVGIQQKIDQDSGDAGAINDVVYFDLAGEEWTNAPSDTLHFNAEGQRIRGDYAGQLLAHRLSNSVGDWPSPRVQN